MLMGGDSSEDYELLIRQGPERARVAGIKEKGMEMAVPLRFIHPSPRLAETAGLDRKPVDPPPIIQLKIRDDTDPAQ